jgi:hypothetical protein
MRAPINVSAVEPVGTVNPELRPVIAIGRVDDDANRRVDYRAAVIASGYSEVRTLLFLQKRQERFVTAAFHFFFRNEMEGGRIDGVTLSGGRFRIGKEMAKVSVASFGAHLRTLHIVRSVQVLDEEIFRDRFAKCGHAYARVVFVERNKEWFAGDDIDINAGALVVPELVLENPLGATFPHHEIFLGLQPVFQDGVARDRPVRIETCRLLFLFLREKEEVEPRGNEHDRDTDTDVRADGRSFLAGDLAPVHQIANT